MFGVTIQKFSNCGERVEDLTSVDEDFRNKSDKYREKTKKESKKCRFRETKLLLTNLKQGRNIFDED